MEGENYRRMVYRRAVNDLQAGSKRASFRTGIMSEFRRTRNAGQISDGTVKGTLKFDNTGILGW